MNYLDFIILNASDQAIGRKIGFFIAMTLLVIFWVVKSKKKKDDDNDSDTKMK